MLVTRPQPDNEATAASLRAKGFEVLLAPMLRFEPVVFAADPDAAYGGIIVTSANALRAIEGQASIAQLLGLPLFAVGSRTAQAAGEAGFRNVIVAGGDASALRDTIVAAARGRKLKKSDTLLYLSGADIARDLPGELRALGFNIATQTAYKMISVPLSAGRCLRRFRGEPDRGGTALFGTQRPFVSRCGAGRGHRDFGAGDSAMLSVRGGRCGGA